MKKQDFNFMQKGELGLLPPFVQYFYNLGILVSQGISTLLGGDPDETLSSRTGKAVIGGNWFATYLLSPLLDLIFMEPNHALNSVEEDEGQKEVWAWSDYYKDKNKKVK